jgi:hypothetical protein
MPVADEPLQERVHRPGRPEFGDDDPPSWPQDPGDLAEALITVLPVVCGQ